jgi:hypothetical protein
LNVTFLRDTAVYSLIGMFTSPKLIAPLHVALGMQSVCPNRRSINSLTSLSSIYFSASRRLLRFRRMHPVDFGLGE